MVEFTSRIANALAEEPGISEEDLAQLLYGDRAFQHQLNSRCLPLIDAGKIERQGDGSADDPFTYRLASVDSKLL